MILAIDRASHWHAAALAGGAFALGGLWAMALTLALGLVRPYRAVFGAVGEVYAHLATMADDLRDLAADASDAPAWDDHARAHRRAVREAIELARTLLVQTLRLRGPVTGMAVQTPLRLEAADAIFGALIGLSSLMENTPSLRAPADRVLRLLAPLLRAIGEAISHEQAPASAGIERGISVLQQMAAAEPGLTNLLEALVERVKAGMAAADARVIGRGLGQTLKDALTWRSAQLRHALRIMLLGGAAIAASMLSGAYYSHWLAITLVLTLQPFFADTRRRAIERAIGTGVGVAGVSLLAMALSSPAMIAMALVPVTLIAFALRRVSFALFVSGLTPFVVLLLELGHPGAGTGSIAIERLVYTLCGVIFAVVGNRFLFPLWEPGRLREQLAAALAAHARWLMAEKTDDQARRLAGQSSNALEASLARALAEPRTARDQTLDQALLADAALRRIGGHLTALALQTLREPPDWVWRGYGAALLRALAAGEPKPERPQTPLPEGLRPIIQQVELLAGAFS